MLLRSVATQTLEYQKKGKDITNYNHDNQFKEDRVAWHVVLTGKMENTYKILVGKHEEEGQIGRISLKREGHAIMDLTGLLWDVVKWIHLAQNRDQWWALVKTIMNLRIPYKAGNFFTN
jgi:hypothetical protein